MFLYPLAIVLILLTFASPLFKDARLVYATTIAVTFVISIIDGLKALCESMEIAYFGWLEAVMGLLKQVLPLYEAGLGWLLPALLMAIIATVIHNIRTKKTA